LSFNTCLAGTSSFIQSFMMLLIEKIYHKFYTQVKFHREIFKFNDGG